MHFYHEYSSKFAFKYLFAHKIELNTDEKFLQRCASLVNPPLIHLWHKTKLLLFVAVRCLFIFKLARKSREKKTKNSQFSSGCLVEPTGRLSRDFVS